MSHFVGLIIQYKFQCVRTNHSHYDLCKSIIMSKQVTSGTWNEPRSLQRSSKDVRTVIGSVVIEIHNQTPKKPVIKRRHFQIVFDHERELVIGARPPRLQPLRLQPGIPGPIMHKLFAESPLEIIDELQDPMRGSQIAVQLERIVVGGGEMVNVDMEVDGIGEVVGGGEGAEAAGERIEAVECEDLDDEGEIGGLRVRVFEGIDKIRVRVRGGEIGVEEEEEEGGDGEEKEEWEEVSFGTHHLREI